MERRNTPKVQHSSSARAPSSSLPALCLLAALAWAVPAQAQSCPSSYSACDNGGCCLASDQCCPKMEEGCCPGATPYCCGDGSCAASPAECGNGRSPCNGYDIPCGNGCAPAGSQCCDLAGHYCPPQGICTSDTTCIAGEQGSVAMLVIASSAPEPAETTARTVSPLINPPHGSERSCAFTPPAERSALSSRERGPLWSLERGPLWSLASLLALIWLRRNKRSAR